MNTLSMSIKHTGPGAEDFCGTLWIESSYGQEQTSVWQSLKRRRMRCTVPDGEATPHFKKRRSNSKKRSSTRATDGVRDDDKRRFTSVSCNGKEIKIVD